MIPRMRAPFVFLSVLVVALSGYPASHSLVLEPEGEPRGLHVVLVSGDEEYRGEEALPMLAHILTRRHGFTCTVLFALDADGTINPDNIESLGDPEALDDADVIVMALRWRDWPDEIMRHFVDAFHRGVPIIALRTSTHAFKPSGGSYQEFEQFGKNVLGEDWVDHWGHHNFEATLALVEPGAENHPLLRGVAEIFAPTDVYEVYPPDDVSILMRGQVLEGMDPGDAPATHMKKRSTDQAEQPVNDPMMPVVWTRDHRNEAGNVNRILVTTMGAAVDLRDESLRRLIVNGVYWCLDLEVPDRADVNYVGPYDPSWFGPHSDGFRHGLMPDDYDFQK